MELPKQSLIDMDINSSLADTQLQFQEFSTSSVNGAAELDIKSSQTLTFNHTPDTPGSDNDVSPESHLLTENGVRPSPSFWTFEFYQQLFDVDTKCVTDRILWSMIPRPGTSFLQHHIKPKPDLYGPFWIAITLVFTIGISGNLANYIQTYGVNYHWKYDFHVVTYAATAIFSYTWIVPMILWGIFRWRGDQDVKLTFLELLCVYGYSLSIYIPVSILWLIPLPWLQWILVAVGAALSGSVLLMTTWPAAHGNRLLIVCLVLGIHILLAVGFKLYFFHVPPQSTTVTVFKNVTSQANH